MEDNSTQGGMESIFDMGDDLQLNLDDLGLEPTDDTTGDAPDTTNTDTPTGEETDVIHDPENVGSEDNNPDGEGDDASNDDSPNIYSSLTNILSEQGLLPDLDLTKTKVQDVDGLTAALKAQIDTQTKNFIVDKLGEDGYNAIEKGVSLAEYQQYQANMDTFSSITEDLLSEDAELSQRIIYQDLVNQGIPEARAQRFLQRSIDSGNDGLFEDARESLASLKEHEYRQLERVQAERAQAQQDAVKQQEKLDNDLKNYIYGKEELIAGMKVSKGMQDKIYESMNKTVSVAEDGTKLNGLMAARQANPIEFDTKLYYMFELTKGFTDMSKVNTKAISKSTDDLERAMRNQRFASDGRADYLTDSDSYDSGFGDTLHLG
jgi:hypothetical protein